MEKKLWRFKVHGDSNWKEVIIDASEYWNVYDLLEKLRSAESDASRKEQDTEENSNPKAV